MVLHIMAYLYWQGVDVVRAAGVIVDAHDDVDRITYDLCHLYPLADNTASYATPIRYPQHRLSRPCRGIASGIGSHGQKRTVWLSQLF